jgi:hypothetical protein
MDITRKQEKCQAFFQKFSVFKKNFSVRLRDDLYLQHENHSICAVCTSINGRFAFSFDARRGILYSIAIQT